MDYLDSFQSETVLVLIVDDLWREQDKANATILALLDLSVAFNHGTLLGQLQGMGGTFLHWFGSFLQGWSQSVLLGTEKSSP